jgi:hypothetical protein
MAHPISSVTSKPPVADPAQKPAKAKDASPPPAPAAAPASQTTVSISDAAKAALLEATETPAQTAKEARGHDLQAQRLLAKENAAKLAATKT